MFVLDTEVIAQHPNEFAKGLIESQSSYGETYDNDPESDRSRSYDSGRTIGDLLDEAWTVSNIVPTEAEAFATLTEIVATFQALLGNRRTSV